jgi:hypothetical protein
MTIDEIVQKIYEERYQEPSHPEIAEMLRDGMVREIVERTLELSDAELRTAVRRLVDAWNRTQTTFGVDETVHAAVTELEKLCK